jgi:gliding motility-associated-like protein
MRRPGNFVIQLQRGTDGNTIIDECGIETPAGSSIPFRIRDTVNADFTFSIQYGCSVDVVNFFHPGANDVTKWTWKLDQGLTSTQQSPQANYTVFTPKNVELIVSNGLCSDTSKAVVALENFLSADFNTYPDNCPLEPVAFTGIAVGKITRQDWSFGDGGTGSGGNTTHIFAQPSRETVFNVRYTVTDSFGCSKTAQKPIKIYSSCIVKVPNAFSPNGNRTNEFLYPLNAVKAEQLEFTVYNRWGQMIFRTTDWKRGWDGRLNGQPQPTGTYVWTLRYVDRDTRKRVEQKGFTILIR